MARRTFFSFHYGNDIWRASNVRNCWVGKEREIAGFFDNSLWERTKREGAESLKGLIRSGMTNTTVTCVLNGSETYSRRWVRYEIVRSIVRGNGLLTVDIDGVRDNKGLASYKGPNPLDYIGLYRTDDSKIHFAEVNAQGQWVVYSDYTLAISPSDLWFRAPTTSTPIRLSSHCGRYDFAAQNGRQNIGTWIESAAGIAGR